jgi:hypothetical protein
MQGGKTVCPRTTNRVEGGGGWTGLHAQSLFIEGDMSSVSIRLISLQEKHERYRQIAISRKVDG